MGLEQGRVRIRLPLWGESDVRDRLSKCLAALRPNVTVSEIFVFKLRHETSEIDTFLWFCKFAAFQSYSILLCVSLPHNKHRCPTSSMRRLPFVLKFTSILDPRRRRILKKNVNPFKFGSSVLSYVTTQLSKSQLFYFCRYLPCRCHPFQPLQCVSLPTPPCPALPLHRA